MRYREARKIKAGDKLRVKFPKSHFNIIVLSILNTGTSIFFDGNNIDQNDNITHTIHHRRVCYKVEDK